MRRIKPRYALAGLAMMFSLLVAGAAPAQIKFEIEGGEQLAVAYLESRGFTQIKIIANELFQVRAEGCKDGVRYRFRVRIDGRIFDLRKIGNCGAITKAQVRQILQKQGYRRIDVAMQNNRYVAFGCKQADRYRLVLRLDGKILDTRRVGTCGDVLSPGDVAARLREQGFDRIDFTDNQLPNYVATACLGEVKFELVIDGQGNIKRERRIGRCTPPIDPRDIVSILQRQGYSRIEVIDSHLPRYVAEACKGNKHVEVTLDRFGRITKVSTIGTCKPKLSAEQIAEILERRGFLRIHIVKADAEGYTVDACYKRRNLRMMFNIYGDFVSERDRGPCVSRRVSEVLKELRDLGYSELTLEAEGCRANRRERFELDELGDTVKRERLGGC
ncbi:MAG: hypothetical protein R3D45_16730 [Rhizobiaceae bacterium]